METLTAPLDGMWETFIRFAAQWEIRRDGARIGYFCVNDEGRLLQFHVAAPFEDQEAEAFAQAVRESDASGAMVSTFEPWLSLCLDLHKQVRVHTFLYHDHHRSEISLDGFDGVRFEIVPEGERTAVEAFIRRCLADDPGDWLTGYVSNLVARRELLALRTAETWLGTGELRVSDTQPPYADLGVIVSPEHRGRGLAPHILSRLKERCESSGLVPICSTTADNEAAQRAILKAGFVPRHRLLEVLF